MDRHRPSERAREATTFQRLDVGQQRERPRAGTRAGGRRRHDDDDDRGDVLRTLEAFACV